MKKQNLELEPTLDRELFNKAIREVLFNKPVPHDKVRNPIRNEANKKFRFEEKWGILQIYVYFSRNLSLNRGTGFISAF